MCSTSLLPRVAPIAIGPNIAAVPEDDLPVGIQADLAFEFPHAVKNRQLNHQRICRPLSTDCMLWIFLCLALALAGLFTVGVCCTVFQQAPPTLVSFLLRPSSPRIPTSTEAQAYWTASSCASAVPTRSLLTGSKLDSSQWHFFCVVPALQLCQNSANIGDARHILFAVGVVGRRGGACRGSHVMGLIFWKLSLGDPLFLLLGWPLFSCLC